MNTNSSSMFGVSNSHLIKAFATTSLVRATTRFRPHPRLTSLLRVVTVCEAAKFLAIKTSL